MVEGIQLCECGKELQEGILGGQHLLRCGSGSERNDTHHSIRDTMFYIMRGTGYSVRREQSGVMRTDADSSGRDTRQGDGSRCSRRFSGAGGDVVVADPTRSTVVRAVAWLDEPSVVKVVSKSFYKTPR
jgi:hypothetical protein